NPRRSRASVYPSDSISATASNGSTRRGRACATAATTSSSARGLSLAIALVVYDGHLDGGRRGESGSRICCNDDNRVDTAVSAAVSFRPQPQIMSVQNLPIGSVCRFVARHVQPGSGDSAAAARDRVIY